MIHAIKVNVYARSIVDFSIKIPRGNIAIRKHIIFKIEIPIFPINS